jgi:hypothetical protein
LRININVKSKVRIHQVAFEGNDQVSSSVLKRKLKKTKEHARISLHRAIIGEALTLNRQKAKEFLIDSAQKTSWRQVLEFINKNVKLNFFKHVESCDPVVVDRDFAYFTTRKEATCKRGQNMLTVLDVKDFNDVKLISEFPMQHPHGLGVKEDKLYIADGEFGLKVFDITKKDSISDKLVYKDTMYHSFDVIPHFYKPYLISVGKNGLLQYDISDIKKIKKIGSIMVYEN